MSPWETNVVYVWEFCLDGLQHEMSDSICSDQQALEFAAKLTELDGRERNVWFKRKEYLGSTKVKVTTYNPDRIEI